jgi:predicted ferric reductase
MSWEWLVIRGSGMAAFILLSGSTIWGLLVSSKALGKLAKIKALTWFHESLGISALLATGIHMFALSIHDFLPFTWGEILIPGKSSWRTLPVALGVISFYTLAIIIVSFYVKKHIGQKVWRGIHFASFGLFISALLHGVLAGTDTQNPWVIGMYVVSAVTVFGLLAHRMTPPDPGGAVASDLIPAKSGFSSDQSA